MKRPYRVIIAGGREFDDFQMLKEVADYMLSKRDNVEIVSGTARGTARGGDKLGEKYAKARGYELEEFPAPWTDVEGKVPHEIGHHKDGRPYWKGAGHYRNEQMAEYADAAIVFWDGSSKGTRKMIELATVKGLKLKVCQYE